MPPLKARHLLLLGYPVLVYVIRDLIKYGLHPDDRREKS